MNAQQIKKFRESAEAAGKIRAEELFNKSFENLTPQGKEEIIKLKQVIINFVIVGYLSGAVDTMNLVDKLRIDEQVNSET